MRRPSASPRRADPDSLAVALLVALVATLPLYAEVTLWQHPDAFDPSEWVAVAVYDIAQAGLVVRWWMRGGARRLLGAMRTTAVGRVGAVLAVTAVASSVVHPAWRAIDLGYRFLAIVAVVDAFRRLEGKDRNKVLGALVAVGCVESVLAIAQSVHRRSLGLGPFEYDLGLFRFGDAYAGQAGFFHPYLLAAFLLVALGASVVAVGPAATRWPWLIGASVIAAGLARTYSRAAVLGLVAALVVIVVVPRRDASTARRLAALAIALGFAAGALSGLSGWEARAETTASRQADSGRLDRYRDALGLIEDNPVLGVGPGRYTTALRETSPSVVVHSHQTVLQVAAEAGILAGAAAVALLAFGSVAMVRAGPMTVMLLVLVAPLWLLDSIAVVYPVGIATMGLWMGVVAVAFEEPWAGRAHRSPSRRRGAPAAAR